MPHQLIYDWQQIQQYYDEGHSLRECQSEFGFGMTAYTKAVKSGRFKLRSHKEACNLNKPIKIEPTGKSFSETTWKGEVACLKLEARALQKGAIVSRPNFECAYDRVIDWEGKLYKVQVKYAGGSEEGVVLGRVTRTCRTRNRKASYNIDHVDVVVLYDSERDVVYWLPKDIWAGKKIVSLRVQPPKNHQEIGVRYAVNYQW